MVILSTVHPEIDKIFDYAVPENLETQVCSGVRVLVPFGYRNTRTEGYVISVSDKTEVPSERIKQIFSVLDEKPLFSQELLDIAEWMKEKYYTTLSQCLFTIMPAGIQSKTEWIVERKVESYIEGLTEKEKQILDFLSESGNQCSQLEIERQLGKGYYSSLKALCSKKIVKMKQVTHQKNYITKIKMVSLTKEQSFLEEEKKKISNNKRLEGQRKALSYLEEKQSPVPLSLLKKELNIGISSIQTLEKKGLLQITEMEQKRELYSSNLYSPQPMPILTQEQEEVIAKMKKEWIKKEKKPILLHGITGSGKTEVYMQIIEMVIREGRQAIVLVPEISLTPLMVGRFITRFGDKVAVTHSKMNYGERYEQWQRARQGEASVMIGPRSAVFAPFEKLGVIIIDEEHENSYQSETTPKYDAREVAEKRCEITEGLLILGSATPDLASYHKAQQGKFCLLQLKKRAKESELPSVAIEDMRKELAEGNYSMFSRQLFEAMRENLENKMQTILFLNRRGFSTFVSCRKCGYVMMCDNCNVAYTYHAGKEELICHYCGKKVKNPQVCPECGSKYIRYFGTGTQKVEAEVKKVFPQARVLRMDFDTTSKKHSMEQILEAFGKEEADILIGTQMIAKGHDFPKVTLVGVIAADLSLHNGDYRGAETTFQLITQVAGRAGRDQFPGRVLIQTYHPEHYAIALAAKQDYEAFYEKEILVRKVMDYPPFSHVASILITGPKEENVIKGIQELYQIFAFYNRKEKFLLLGPSPAVISKIKGDYRWKLLIKCKEEERLRAYALYCLDKFGQKRHHNILVNLSINPVVIV